MEPKVYRGVVERGAGRGAALGFPTANIPLADDSVSGIYAARAKIKDEEAPYSAAVYADQKRKLLEVHILDFSDKLYGMEIEVTLLEKIREAAVFESEMALRAAIADDIAKVRDYFLQHRSL